MIQLQGAGKRFGHKLLFENGECLLGGGSKKRQNRDIQSALNHWKAYKYRKER